MKTKLINYITGNQSKFDEAKEIFKNKDIDLIKKDLKIEEIKSLDQKKVIIDKARKAYNILKKPLIIDDVGIYFNAYNNFPGTYTRFLYEAIGYDGIKKLLKDKGNSAYFKILICYKDKDAEMVFEGVLNGRIIENKSDVINKNFQYDSIFIPESYEIPLSEIALEKRAEFSHRKIAIDKLIKWINDKNARN